MPVQENRFKAVVLGASAGGLEAMSTIFSMLPGDFELPVIVAQHLSPATDGFRFGFYNDLTPLTVKEADDKEAIRKGYIYMAPANYHLLIERDETFALNIDEKVNYSRPSIDVLFESAARVWGSRLIGLLLTGANSDGSRGMGVIKERGGLTIVQDPETAPHPAMPRFAIDSGVVDRVLSLEGIGLFLKKIAPSRSAGIE